MNDGTLLLARAEISRLRRNRRYLLMTLALPIILYLVIGAQVTTVVDGLPFAAYYMIGMAAFGSFSGALMNNSVRIAQERKEGWIRQLRLTPLPARGYVVAKLLASMAISIPSVVIVLLLGHFVGHVHMAASAWILVAIVVWLGALTFAALAVAIGYRFQPDQVQPLATLIYFIFIVLGGVFFPLGSTLEKIGKFTPTYEAVTISISLAKSQPVDGLMIVGLVIWLAVFVSLAALSVRATAEAV
ncbi:MAG TPA: ABC transporter permease [Trebonia sp.]|jgi:ABC-2 type transport system permease protein|nr:ABC transporter permease [Trebonia sp.]